MEKQNNFCCSKSFIEVNKYLLSLYWLGWILIDRCGKHFPLILNFLRDGSAPLPQSEVELQELLMEAKYYLIEQLVELCEKALEKKKEEHDPICRVPLITSAKEERQLVTGKKVKNNFWYTFFIDSYSTYWEAAPRDATPYHFIHHFWQKKCSFYITSTLTYLVYLIIRNKTLHEIIINLSCNNSCKQQFLCH